MWLGAHAFLALAVVKRNLKFTTGQWPSNLGKYINSIY
jgi:hypothetical protein